VLERLRVTGRDEQPAVDLVDGDEQRGVDAGERARLAYERALDGVGRIGRRGG
jgi:hypothetical protein